MLNLPERMNEHYSKNVDEMPKILRAGEIPISVAGIMQARLKQGDEFSDLWNNWYDASDLVVYPKGDDKNIYVLLTVNNQGEITKNGRKALELIRPDNLASNRGATVEQLRNLGRKGLIKVPRNKITTDTYLTSNKILDEQTWRILARHPDEVPSEFAEDKDLLKDYSSEVQKRTRNKENMALYLGSSLKDKTTLKAWCVDWLVLRSDALGRLDLDIGDGRFVGIAPEALSALGKGIEAKFYSVGEILEESGDTNDFAPNQIRKFSNILEQGNYQIQKKK